MNVYEDKVSLREIEANNRQFQVIQWINSGFSRFDIHKLIESTYGLKTAVSRNKLIKDSLLKINEGLDIEDMREINKERMETIFNKAINEGNYKAAISAIDQQNKLLGLYSDNKAVKITNEDNIIEILF